MKKNISILSAFLVCFFLFQINLSGFSVWCPDFIILIVVFSAVYLGVSAGILIGLIAGILKGSFSVYLFPVDIIIYPVIALVADMLAGMFYKQNPLLHMFLSAMAVFFILTVHGMFLNTLTGSDMRFSTALFNSWRVIILTIISAPLLFPILNLFLDEEWTI